MKLKLLIIVTVDDEPEKKRSAQHRSPACQTRSDQPTLEGTVGKADSVTQGAFWV